MFLNIKDPKLRDEVFRDYSQTKQSIRASDRARRLGESELKRETAKLFKPLTETQERTRKDIVDELRPMRESSLRMGPFSDWTRLDDRPLSERTPTGIETDASSDVSSIVSSDASSNGGKRDPWYGFRQVPNTNQIFVGDTEVIIKDDYLHVGPNTYDFTDGLKALLLYERSAGHTDQDLDNYGDILVQTNAMKKNDNPHETRMKSNRGYKWKEIVKPIWDANRKHLKSMTGKGMIERRENPKTTFLSSDSDALLERLGLLMASREAGNTGVDNEIVSVCDELLRQKVLTRKDYKQLMNRLKD